MKSRLQVIVVLLFIGIAGVIFLLSGKEKEEKPGLEIVEETVENVITDNKVSASEPAVTTAVVDKTADNSPVENVRIFVHVCGAVKNEGVYELKSDARVVDAIRAAGGLAGKAASSGINQAEQLKDGMQVYVPTKKEMKASYGQNVATHSLQPKTSENTANSIEANKININTATAEELMRIKGVGETKATLIINYRETNGGFKDITDIMKIKGIKQKFFDKIKDDICV